MELSWLPPLMSVAICIAVVLLVIICLDCRNKGVLVSIRQTTASEDYMPSTEFRVIHPSQPSTDLSSGHLPSNLLSPYPNNSFDPGSQRRLRTYTRTETESTPNYENPVRAGPESQESDGEDTGYIVVLPETDAPPTNPSRASTPSSDVQHDYENMPKSESESSSLQRSADYLNVELLQYTPESHIQHQFRSYDQMTPEISSQSDSDDSENYVNQPPMIHSYPQCMMGGDA